MLHLIVTLPVAALLPKDLVVLALAPERHSMQWGMCSSIQECLFISMLGNDPSGEMRRHRQSRPYDCIHEATSKPGPVIHMRCTHADPMFERLGQKHRLRLPRRRLLEALARGGRGPEGREGKGRPAAAASRSPLPSQYSAHLCSVSSASIASTIYAATPIIINWVAQTWHPSKPFGA